MTDRRPCLAIILAAGQGTRMQSARPKVLHEVAGRAMLDHALGAAEQAGASPVVVIGAGADAVIAHLAGRAPTYTQAEQRGTAHAVLAARAAIDANADLIVLCGDTPLLGGATLARVRAGLRTAGLVVLGFDARQPQGYGRLLLGGDGQLAAIREEKDASAAERAITLCNAGVYAFRAGLALPLLERVGNANAQGEYYLPDVVALARGDGHTVAVIETDEAETLGVNDRVQLAAAEQLMQARLRVAAMRGGATLIAPETVFLSADTRLARDVVVEPHCVFGPGVSVGEGAVIHAFSHLAGSAVAAGASVGPYARLRPGTRIGAGARIGNFVETKAADIAAGAKVNHLSYIGDAAVGAGANIGAGTITCNYDGHAKHRTAIGAGAFIGSNSALVAPVSIGDGAVVAAGSTITRNVPADALAVARAPQSDKPAWAARMRARRNIP